MQRSTKKQEKYFFRRIAGQREASTKNCFKSLSDINSFEETNKSADSLESSQLSQIFSTLALHQKSHTEFAA